MTPSHDELTDREREDVSILKSNMEAIVLNMSRWWGPTPGFRMTLLSIAKSWLGEDNYTHHGFGMQINAALLGYLNAYQPTSQRLRPHAVRETIARKWVAEACVADVIES